MKKLINTTIAALVGVMLSMPVLADKMMRDEKSFITGSESKAVTVKEGCDCNTLSDVQLKEAKKHHPMNSNILRDKR